MLQVNIQSKVFGVIGKVMFIVILEVGIGFIIIGFNSNSFSVNFIKRNSLVIVERLVSFLSFLVFNVWDKFFIVIFVKLLSVIFVVMFFIFDFFVVGSGKLFFI